MFSKPGGGNIQSDIIRQIEATPSGSYIRTVNWAFTRTKISDALIEAHRDGAVVRVLVSRYSRDSVAVNALQSALGSDCSSGSCAKIIDFAARGPNTFDGEHTTMHQKSWTFSTTGDSKRVTLISSCNPTDESFDHQYCAAYQFVENEAVYDKMVNIFEDQTRDDGGANPFRNPTISDTVSLWFSPWDSPERASSTVVDPVVDRIQSLPTNNLIIRIAMSSWWGDRGERIARAVATKANNGAKVFVLASEPFGAGVRQILSAAGIPIHDGYFNEKDYHHLKFMTARWGTGDNVKTRVWNGSENWTNESRGNDELVFQVGGGSTHTDYVNFFDAIYN